MSNSQFDEDPDRFINADKIAMAALPASKEAKSGVKFEFWFNEQNGDGLQFRRALDDAGRVSFEIVLLKNGSEKSAVPVPESAYGDLQKVFILGGSFIEAATKHMPKDLVQFLSVDSSFAPLYEWFQLNEDQRIQMGKDAPLGWLRNRI